MKAIDRATGYLNIKPRTEFQVRKYLAEKGYDEKDTDEAVSILKEYDYIDDLRYAEMYFELGFEKGRGLTRIRRELFERGIDKLTVEEALENLDSIPDQFQTALELGRTIVDDSLKGEDPEEAFQAMDYNEKNRLRGKVARRLAGRGYGGDIPFRVAREVVR